MIVPSWPDVRSNFCRDYNDIGWTRVNTGLTDSTISSITVILVSSLVISGNTIFATAGNSVWRRPLSKMIPPTNSHGSRISSNLPATSGSPSTKQTSLYSCPCDGPVTVELVNIAERRIYSGTPLLNTSIRSAISLCNVVVNKSQ